MIEEYLTDEAATLAAGARLGRCFELGLVVHLVGDLGVGKTTFCRGFLQARGHSGPVKSPTYTLVEPYDLSSGQIYHFDLYRLGHPEELEYMGIRDYFNPDSGCLIEWPERGEGVLPSPDIRVSIRPDGSGRRLGITAESSCGRQRLAAYRADAGHE